MHAPRLWGASQTLVEALLPDVAAPIVGLKDEDPILQFIHQYRRVSESMQTPEGNAEWPDAIDPRRLAFGPLPPAEHPPADA